MDGDPARFDGVEILGVDEHIWHHVSPLKRGLKELTGMVKLTRDEKGNTRATLLDLVPGRSGTVRHRVRRLAQRTRGRVQGRREDRHPGPVSRVQERDRRPARGCDRLKWPRCDGRFWLHLRLAGVVVTV